MAPAPERRWLLALSGGGYRGLFTAQILARLEAEVGPLHKIFDLIAGTSIGSILALGLARGMPALELVEFFKTHGSAIFPELTPWQRLRNLWRSKYPANALASCLAGVFQSEDFATLKTRVIIPAVDLTDSGPALFRTKSGSQPASSAMLRDAALASAAAPTYFPPHSIGARQFADGGLIANSPDSVAMSEATAALGWPLTSIHLLSIGTTEIPSGLAWQAYPGNWGIVRWAWALRLINQMMAAQAKLARESAQLTLGRRYFAIDSIRSPDQNRVVGLDRASSNATQTLIGMADAAWDETRSREAAMIEALKRHARNSQGPEPGSGSTAAQANQGT
jgi:predicted acylesterase/phospholipase RssA